MTGVCRIPYCFICFNVSFFPSLSSVILENLLYSSSNPVTLNWGAIHPPREDIWRSVEIFLVVTEGMEDAIAI